MSLAGEVALVTGGNHGIGAATAIALAALGADVGVTFLRSNTGAQHLGRPADYVVPRQQDASGTLAAVRSCGVRGFAVEADLVDPMSAAFVFDAVEAELGPIGILVHNASGWRQDTFRSGDVDHFGQPSPLVNAASFDAQFQVDARAGALLMAELARRHRARGGAWGRIVTLTSGGSTGFPGEVSYGAAKAALENYTMSAASELAGLGITANVVHPPMTDTGWITDEMRRGVDHGAGPVRIAAPAEVAAVIAWLCTPDADLVTGNVIRLQ